MTQVGFKRKLTAILGADVAGCSQLMTEDETTTVKMTAIYREITASLIKQLTFSGSKAAFSTDLNTNRQ